jgi:hypothetical protein
LSEKKCSCANSSAGSVWANVHSAMLMTPFFE